MSKPKILIVEDESIVAKDIELTLKHLGYDVIDICDNGDEAYEKAVQFQPDLILMDIFIKNSLDGIETAKRIKARLDIPIIYLTAFSDNLTLQRAKQTSPEGYLVKPFDERDLHVTVEIVLSKAKLQRELDSEKQKTIILEKKAREFAETESKNKDLLLSTLSHELRTPLANILSWVELLLTENPNPETLEQGLKIIQKNAKSQTVLINDLLDVSSMLMGKFKMENQKMNCLEVLELALASIKPVAQEKKLKITTHLECTNKFIWGDPVRVQQIFWNLLHNALKFTKQNGELSIVTTEINLTAGQPALAISITDNGQGIAPENLPKIFDRFYQVQDSEKKSNAGLGLGLAIVQELVSLHGGHVSVYSKGLGYGSTFTVELPLMKD